MKRRQHPYKLCLVGFLLATCLGISLAPPAYGDDGAFGGFFNSKVDAYIFCNSERLEISSCGRFPMSFSLFSSVSNDSDGYGSDSNIPSIKYLIKKLHISLSEIPGADPLRRMFARPQSDFDAGLIKSILEGKMLGLGYRYYLAPSLKLSWQGGIGFTGGEPDPIITLEIKYTF
jgi:hypothetical protein